MEGRQYQKSRVGKGKLKKNVGGGPHDGGYHPMVAGSV